jgi:hypothetical protein
VPHGAAELGYTRCIIDEHPVAADIARDGSKTGKWFSGEWYMQSGPTLDHYTTKKNALAISLGGDLTSVALDSSPGRLPLLSGAKGFYVDFTAWLSGNDPDHWPAVWLMPVEHNAHLADHDPADPPGAQRWMELDVDEGGFCPGFCGTVHAWSGIYPHCQNLQNTNNLSPLPLDRTHKHTFGASYDPVTGTVTWWLDGRKQYFAQSPYVPKIAARQHFYLILSAQTRGANKPFVMYVSRVRAYVPRTGEPLAGLQK